MQTIPSLFVRPQGQDLVVNEVTPGCEWVVAGEGVATRKWDGTACMIRGDKLYRRHTLRPGKVAPPDFEPVGGLDESGKQPGWVPVGPGPEDKYHREALKYWERVVDYDGTYELIGPKVQGNPEDHLCHKLIRHGAHPFFNVPCEYEGVRAWLETHPMEGIVWHHHDGRRCKIKRRDFGLVWPIPKQEDG